MSKHTPDFWRRGTNFPLLILGGEKGRLVCRAESEEDARLIAAAPALLKVVREVEWQANDAGHDICSCCTAFKGCHHDDGCELAAALALVDGGGE